MDVFHRLGDHHEPIRENFLLYFVGGVGRAHVYSCTPQQQMSFCSAPAYLLFPAALLPMFSEARLGVLSRVLRHRQAIHPRASPIRSANREEGAWDARLAGAIHSVAVLDSGIPG